MIRAASVLLGVAVTGIVLWWLVTPEIVAALRAAGREANWWALAAALALTAFVQWLRAWRFAIMSWGGLAPPDARLIRITFQLGFFNFVLPFRLGELSYPVLMRRTFGQPLLQAAGVLVIARFFDLCVVAAILLGAAAWLGLGGGRTTILLAGAAAALALLPAGAVLLGQAVRPLLLRVPGVGTIAGPLGAGLDALGAPPTRLAALALSWTLWLVFGLLAILTADAVADGIAPAAALLGAAAGNLAFALPISGIAGLGASQAAWVAALSAAGVPWSDAVVSALALYAVTLAGALGFGGLAMLGGLGLRPLPEVGGKA